MNNYNNKTKQDFLLNLLRELEQESNEDTTSEDDIEFELKMLSNGSRTRPVFYD